MSSITGLYIAVIDGRLTFLKPGITEDMYDRLKGYGKTGNITTIHFLCVCRPGFSAVIKTLENDGKVFFKEHFSKFNGYNSTEYIDPAATGITLRKLEQYYRKKIKSIPSIHIIKKEHLPLTVDSPWAVNILENAIKYPEKYIEGF